MSVIADGGSVEQEEGRAGRRKRWKRVRGRRSRMRVVPSQESCSSGQMVLVGSGPLTCACVSECGVVFKSLFFIFLPPVQRES